MLHRMILMACVVGLFCTMKAVFAEGDSELMARAALEGIRAGDDCKDLNVIGPGCDTCYTAPGPGGFFWKCNPPATDADCKVVSGACVACVSGNSACPGTYFGYVDAKCTIPSAPPPGNDTTLPCATTVGFSQTFMNAIGGMACSDPTKTCP